MFAIYYMPKEMSGNVQFPISSFNTEALTNSQVILQSIEAEVEKGATQREFNLGYTKS